MLKISFAPANPRQIFTFLVAFRWLSLLPAAGLWFISSQRPLPIPLLLAVLSNIFITHFATQLNDALQERPWLLLPDLVLMSFIIGLSGAAQPSFYLYALSPLLIAAFFFGLRGALVATTVALPFYLAAPYLMAPETAVSPGWLLLFTAVSGSYLISGAFGYASGVVRSLHQAQTSLTQSHRDLELIHQLTLSLQSASSVEEVQEKVLDTVTAELGFSQAIIGLVDEESGSLVSWLGRSTASPSFTSQVEVPLHPEGGTVAQALLTRQILLSNGRGPISSNAALNDYLQHSNGRVLPMLLREHPVGVLIVSHPTPPTPSQLKSLEAIVDQAAVTIGATLLCVNRARKLAVQEERLRIAQDIHDTVSQSLFGIVFTLDGCLKLLPDQPTAVVPELERALQSADAVRQEIRHSILDLWPSQLTAERFTADLQKYANELCAHEVQFVFDVRGAFAALSPKARRSMYRISQEALNNVVQHAQASEARVCVEVLEGRARLAIRDDGRGFHPHTALAQEFNRGHFGLRGIQERARALGGECHIFSKPGAGTSIVVDIPA